MKLATVATLTLITLGLVGCNSNKNKPAAEPSPTVMDPAPTPPAQTSAPVVVQPTAPAPTEPVTAAPKGAITGHKYTVQKGDTLYNIAVRKYGKGTAANITRIEKANPGLSATTLKAGQTITLP